MIRAAVALGLITLLAAGAEARPWYVPKAEIWPRWLEHDPRDVRRIDHGAWDSFLRVFVDTAHPSGIHRVRYGDVGAAGRQALAGYLRRLEAVPISGFNRAEQLAYWINVYNALTVKAILDHYPVRSILWIKLTPGWLSFGPWEAKLFRVEGEALSLRDIEHRILRPIWGDPRIHYALNCASLGCPDLSPVAYTADEMPRQLEAAAAAFVNHRRGVDFIYDKLQLSSIYRWYREDWGDSEGAVIEHLKRHGPSWLRASSPTRAPSSTTTTGASTSPEGARWGAPPAILNPR